MNSLLHGLRRLGILSGETEASLPSTPDDSFEEVEAHQLKIPELQAIAQPLWETHGPLCDSRGFTQHTGECWNDTDQTILMNSDITKDILQHFFIHSIFTPEMCNISKKEYKKIVESKRHASIGYTGYAREFSSDIDDGRLGVLNRNLYNYLYYFQRRFLRHYINEAQKGVAEPLCSKGINSLQCAMRGKTFNPDTLGTDFEPCIADVFTKKEYNAGGTVFYILFFILYVINRNISALSLTIKEVLKDKFIEFYFEMIGRKPAILDDYAVNIYIQIEGKSGHAIGFYTCNGVERFFDNNSRRVIDFPYKQFYKLYFRYLANSKRNPVEGNDVSIIYLLNYNKYGDESFNKDKAELLESLHDDVNKATFEILCDKDRIYYPLICTTTPEKKIYYDILNNINYEIINNGLDEINIHEFFYSHKILYEEFQSYFYYNDKKKLGRRGGGHKTKRNSKKYRKTRKHKK